MSAYTLDECMTTGECVHDCMKAAMREIRMHGITHTIIDGRLHVRDERPDGCIWVCVHDWLLGELLAWLGY